MTIHDTQGPALAKRADMLAALEPTPLEVMQDPLRYIAAEHDRLRRTCDLMEHFIEGGRIDGAVLARLHAVIDTDLRLHHADEAEGLFPMIRAVLPVRDPTNGVIDDLLAEHSRSQATVRRVLSLLAGRQSGGDRTLSPAQRNVVKRFVATKRRHFAVEKNIVLIIAASCLKPGHLHRLREIMLEHRGQGRVSQS